MMNDENEYCRTVRRRLITTVTITDQIGCCGNAMDTHHVAVYYRAQFNFHEKEKLTLLIYMLECRGDDTSVTCVMAI